MKQKFRFYVLFSAMAALSLGALPSHLSAQIAISIKGTDNMKYDVTHIDATPGQTLKLTLANVGSLPKASMAHNWVLLKKGVDPMAYAVAASQAKAEDYLPASLSGEVIANTKLLGPGESDTITVKAPMEPGDYVFLCSFPAHYLVGMKGILTVK